ncbi:MAG: VanZ family protein [Spirochaetaceae bacterium]|jgi:hypothetical protein|nr:VanZ family protein [Spirochaetaceae bacterium]
MKNKLYLLAKNKYSVLLRIPGPVILLTSIYLSSRSVITVPVVDVSDKVIHFICFAGLAGAWCWWWNPSGWRARGFRNALVTFFAVSVYGALDELHQSFVPGREVSALDWLADTLGGAAGVFAGYLSVRFILWKNEFQRGNAGAKKE